MRAAVATALVALCWAAPASADTRPVPAGFTANARLSAAASYVAGKPVVSYCARTQDEFDAADWGLGGDGTVGYAYVGGTQEFLSPSVCLYLTKWQAKEKVARRYLAFALLTLAHEAEHLAGVADESIADCKALFAMPKLIARYFPLRKVYTLHDLMGDAWGLHDESGPQYLENCPER
jgi:hypothetical protein